MISIIVGQSKNRVIGKDNDLPWYLPDDLKHFKELTTGSTVIMGRKTYDSILARLGGPLPNRTNIVVTHNLDFESDRAIVVHSLQEAIDSVEDDKAFIIGGARIYEQALPLVDRIYLTEIDSEVDGDTYFPALDMAEWHETTREHHDADTKHAFAFDFVTYDRK